MIIVTEDLCAPGRFLQELPPSTVAHSGWVGPGPEHGPAEMDRGDLQEKHESMGVPKNAKLSAHFDKEIGVEKNPHEERGKQIVGALAVLTIILVDIVLMGLAIRIWSL